MSDPTVIPWVCVWIGLVIVVSGAIISMWAWGQREPTRVEFLGKLVIVVGLVLFIGTPLANALGLLAYALNGAAQDVYAVAHPVPQ
jgi:hypothetical protein